MACKICKRSVCTESFHSIKEQERFEERESMSNDVEELRREIQDLKSEKESIEKELDYDPGLLNDCGGGDVNWWHEYIRCEVSRCNEYWRDRIKEKS